MDRRGRLHHTDARLVACLAALWAGYLLALSFVATPAKFLATSLTLPVALDIGRATFHVSAVPELLLSALLAVSSSCLLGVRARGTAIALTVVLLFAAQHVALLPVLDARVTRVIAGERLAASWHHLGWIAADAVRVVLLLLLAQISSGETSRPVPPGGREGAALAPLGGLTADAAVREAARDLRPCPSPERCAARPSLMIEQRVIALASSDPAWAAALPRSIAGLVQGLFGRRPVLPLANPRLEALRLATISMRRTRKRARFMERLVAAGFSAEEAFAAECYAAQTLIGRAGSRHAARWT